MALIATVAAWPDPVRVVGGQAGAGSCRTGHRCVMVFNVVVPAIDVGVAIAASSTAA